jgi:glc operon protein GlcG
MPARRPVDPEEMAVPDLRAIQSSLTLDAAGRIVDAALAARRKENLLPLAVAVLDAGGNLVAFKRDDGCGVLRFDIARGKAWAALGMGMSSRAIRDRLKDRPAFQSALAAASDGRFVATPGGVLILDPAGNAIGAVGISGDASDKDEYCAIQGVLAAGFAADPPAPHPDWRAAGL